MGREGKWVLKDRVMRSLLVQVCQVCQNDNFRELNVPKGDIG